MTSPPVAESQDDTVTEAPDSPTPPDIPPSESVDEDGQSEIPPSASVDSDGQSAQDKSQASSYHSEDLEDTSGGVWSSPMLSCLQKKEAKQEKKRAKNEAAKAAKKELKEKKKKKAKDSPHPKATEQDRRAERSAKYRKRASDPDYDGLTAFASPDRTGVKPTRSKDEESATSTPDSKKDFQKAKQN